MLMRTITKTLQVAKCMVIAIIGFTLVLLGLILIFTPFPGFLVVIGGLVVLAAEFVWARRLLKKVKKQGMRLRDALFSFGSKIRPTVESPLPPKKRKSPKSPK